MSSELETRTTPRPALHRGFAYRLLVAHGPASDGVGRMWLVGDQPVVIGRDTASADWTFADPEVSRSHAKLEPSQEGAPSIVDLGSHNGTFLNGRPLQGAAVLSGGDVLRMGSHVLVFQALDAEQCAVLLSPRFQALEAELGSAPTMLPVYKAVRHAARYAGPSVVLGPSGAGKERIAGLVHRLTGRKGPYLTVNCAALPEGLAEHELFGHRKGAFTGAFEHSGGLFRDAEGGSLLLDEIGDMPLTLQAKLLRVLATGEVRPVGESRARAVDVKVIAATNVDLELACHEGRFREDLLARLLGSHVRVPALAARRSDVLPLARRFLEAGGGHPSITADAAEALLLHDWPYNVRELEQYMGTFASREDANAGLGIHDLPAALGQLLGRRLAGALQLAASDGGGLPQALLDVPRDRTPDRRTLEKVLVHFQGNMLQTAEFFGKDRRQIYRWTQQHRLDPAAFRSRGLA
jgi:DNA-binding NtrC family response regulator